SKTHPQVGGGRTAMHFAAYHNFANMIRILVKYGGNVNTIDLDEYTPIVYAAKLRGKEAVEELVKHGADLNPNTRKKITPLHQAGFNDNLEFIDLFKDKSCEWRC